MVKPIRRVVTGHDESGKAVVIMDGDAANVVTSVHRPGGRTNLWRTTGAPAGFAGNCDEADAEFTLTPLPNGTNFRISEFPPDDPEQIKTIDSAKAFAEVGAAHLLVDGAVHTTYVAERNLEGDETGDPILHPALDVHFSGRSGGLYVRRARAN